MSDAVGPRPTPADLRARGYELRAKSYALETEGHARLSEAAASRHEADTLFARAARLEETGERRLSELEAAELLGKSLPTLSRWRRQGKPPRFIKNGKRVEYLLSDLESYVHLQRVGSTAELRAREISEAAS